MSSDEPRGRPGSDPVDRQGVSRLPGWGAEPDRLPDALPPSPMSLARCSRRDVFGGRAARRAPCCTQDRGGPRNCTASRGPRCHTKRGSHTKRARIKKPEDPHSAPEIPNTVLETSLRESSCEFLLAGSATRLTWPRLVRSESPYCNSPRGSMREKMDLLNASP